MCAQPPTRTPNRTIANSAITTRSAANCARPVRRFIGRKLCRVRSRLMKFRAPFQSKRPLRQKCGALLIRRNCNHSRRQKDEQRELSGPGKEDRDRQLRRRSCPGARRRIGRAGPQAQSSVCFLPGKRIAWRTTAGRFPDATRSIFIWRTGAK